MFDTLNLGFGNGNGKKQNKSTGLTGADLRGADAAMGAEDLSVPDHVKMADGVTDNASDAYPFDTPDGSEVFSGREGRLLGSPRRKNSSSHHGRNSRNGHSKRNGHTHLRSARACGSNNVLERSKNTGRFIPTPDRRKKAATRDKRGKFRFD